MKKVVLFFIIILIVLLSSSCKELFQTLVRFQNNSTTKTVKAIWDGVNAATLAPGQTSEYREANPGNHTLKWTDAKTGKDLTTTGWPSLVQGNSYTFPYND